MESTIFSASLTGLCRVGSSGRLGHRECKRPDSGSPATSKGPALKDRSSPTRVFLDDFRSVTVRREANGWLLRINKVCTLWTRDGAAAAMSPEQVEHVVRIAQQQRLSNFDPEGDL